MSVAADSQNMHDSGYQMSQRRRAPVFSVIPSISLNTFREAVRNRILYIILIFALLLMASSGIVRDLTIAAHDRVVRDLGLAAINFFGLAVAILVGINLVYNELDKKSIYTIVSKPVSRWQFLLGKYFGLLLTIYVNILIMGVFFLGVINYQDRVNEDKLAEVLWHQNASGQYEQVQHPTLTYTKYVATSIVASAGQGIANLFGAMTTPRTQYINGVIFATMLELAIITAFAILYSSFSTPILSAIFTIMTFIAGRLNQDIWAYAMELEKKGLRGTMAGNIKYYLSLGASHVVPNLGQYRESANQLNQAGYHGVQWVEMISRPGGISLPAGILPYTIFYTAAILGLSVLIFRSRNFK